MSMTRNVLLHRSLCDYLNIKNAHMMESPTQLICMSALHGLFSGMKQCESDLICSRKL